MMLRVDSYLKSAECSLSYWTDILKRIEDGTYIYDNTIPNSCFDALCKSKVEVFTDVVNYLKSLPSDTILKTNIGLTKEGMHYYKLVNR